MPVWLQILLGVATLVGPWIAGELGMRRGMQIGIAVHGEKLKTLEHEVAILRESKHLHASRITEHEAWLEVLKRKEGLGT